MPFDKDEQFAAPNSIEHALLLEAIYNMLFSGKFRNSLKKALMLQKDDSLKDKDVLCEKIHNRVSRWYNTKFNIKPQFAKINDKKYPIVSIETIKACDSNFNVLYLKFEVRINQNTGLFWTNFYNYEFSFEDLAIDIPATYKEYLQLKKLKEI